jgi:cation/acetate symporter
MGWTGGYVLLALLLAPVPAQVRQVHGAGVHRRPLLLQTARIVAVICLILASITYVIGQMKGVGVAFSRFLEVDYDTGLYIGMTIVFVYAVLGGMKGITYTQIAQYVRADPRLHHPGDLHLAAAHRQPAAAARPVRRIRQAASARRDLLAKLDQVVTDLGFKEYTTRRALVTLNMFAYTLSLMIGTAGLPHVIIRFFTVPKVRDARSSAGWALVFIAMLYTTAPAVAPWRA